MRCDECVHGCFTYTRQEAEEGEARIAAQYEPYQKKCWFSDKTRTVYPWPDEFEARADSAYIEGLNIGACVRFPEHARVGRQHFCGEFTKEEYECSSMCCPDTLCKKLSNSKEQDDSPQPTGQDG